MCSNINIVGKMRFLPANIVMSAIGLTIMANVVGATIPVYNRCSGTITLAEDGPAVKLRIAFQKLMYIQSNQAVIGSHCSVEVASNSRNDHVGVIILYSALQECSGQSYGLPNPESRFEISDNSNTKEYCNYTDFGNFNRSFDADSLKITWRLDERLDQYSIMLFSFNNDVCGPYRTSCFCIGNSRRCIPDNLICTNEFCEVGSFWYSVVSIPGTGDKRSVGTTVKDNVRVGLKPISSEPNVKLPYNNNEDNEGGSDTIIVIVIWGNALFYVVIVCTCWHCCCTQSCKDSCRTHCKHSSSSCLDENRTNNSPASNDEQLSTIQPMGRHTRALPTTDPASSPTPQLRHNCMLQESSDDPGYVNHSFVRSAQPGWRTTAHMNTSDGERFESRQHEGESRAADRVSVINVSFSDDPPAYESLFQRCTPSPSYLTVMSNIQEFHVENEM